MPFKHPDYPGIALAIDSVATYVSEMLVDAYTITDEYGEEEMYYQYDQVLIESDTDVMVHMIGDDRPIRVARADLVEIHSDEYCASCGQLGCTALGTD